MHGRTQSEKKGLDRIIPFRSPSQQNLKSVNKLHQAIVQNDLVKLKARLTQIKKAKPELSEFDHMDQTPLNAALRLNSVDFVRELLRFYAATKYLLFVIFSPSASFHFFPQCALTSLFF